MGVQWTAEQKKVIELRDRNILVSAAAGSGKTAVLVERIIQKILDEENPVDVDRLLIVTFTDAAAAEMKERIRAAIEAQLAVRPGDAHLERQATLIHTAPITTIHSFCLSVVRDHFHVIGIDPGFRTAEEGELKLLKQDVLDEMLEACYDEADEEFLAFVERFGTGNNDRKIEEIILRLYEYSRSYPQPEKWLDSCVDSYRMQTDGNSASGAADGENGGDGRSAADAPEMENRRSITQRAALRVRSRAEDAGGILKRCLEMCEEPDGPYMYTEAVLSDLEELEEIAAAEDFEEMEKLASAFPKARLSGKKDMSVSPEKREQAKKLREQAKKLMDEAKKTYFFAPFSVLQKDMEDAAPSMLTLAGLVKRFSAMLAEKKRSRNMIDFNDMEQFALAILTEEKDGVLVPSGTAAEYREQFDEVMIDEYQDSNLVQETILTSVSGVSEGRCNIFMVGDVKQSIYSFRLSRPELFMEKYNTYSLTDGSRQRIDLHKNFRSREEVLASVNGIFGQIMHRDLGGIEYDDSAALYPGADYARPGDGGAEERTTDPLREAELPAGADAFRTELLLLDRESTEEDSREAEARMIARRIHELIRTGIVTDREKGGFRHAEYRDIVVLTRSIKGWAETFTTVFAQEGIPACSVSREGYFETYEVSVLLDYLKILDNFRQDLPLAAVLTSPFAGLSEKELAGIRIRYPNLPFYEAVRSCAAEDGDGGVLRQFLARLEAFREKVPFTPIHDLITEIIEETGYGLFITAMPGGAQRKANLDMLIERAAAFEGTSYKGLFHFVRYIDQLKKYDVDYGEAGIADEQENIVRIMSIHKSKGLEFPVVFVAGMGKQFNMQDIKGAVLIHPDWGVGLDAIDLEHRTKMPTLLKNMIKEETVRDSLAEEMRVLYVALTRAKEKLIITGAVRSAEASLESCVSNVFRPEGARTYLDWILPALISRETGSVREEIPVDISVISGGDLEASQAELTAEELARDVLENWDVSRTFVPGLKERLDAQMNYEYPHAAEGKMKLKFTVSELKQRAAEGEGPDEAGEMLYAEPEIVPLIPEFMKADPEASRADPAGDQEKGLTGASRGSAYHKILELLDFTQNYDESSVNLAVETFLEKGRITEDMAESIRADDILHFLNCESGQRMMEAAKRGRLFREQPFVISMDASAFYPDDCSGEKILVQGIIDVYFEEEDGLVVLDYKTDRVRHAAELKEKYHAQLDYYADALRRLTGKPVKEKIIYSFTLREEIKV